jgi:hypothetical protein
VGSNPAGGHGCVSCECCLLSGRGLCDEPITGLGDSTEVVSVGLNVSKSNNGLVHRN